MNLNRTKILSASTVLCVETIYTQPLQSQKQFLFYMLMLHIFNHSHLLLKSNFYLIKKTLQGAK